MSHQFRANFIPMFAIVVFILTNLFFNPIRVASEVGVCEENEVQTYHLNVDSRGMALCGVSPAPLQTIEHTQHHGECLASCAEFPGCFSYNFHPDSTNCELFCVPEKYAIIPNCFNYLQTKKLFCPTLGPGFCLNGGTCRDVCMNYTCDCLPGYNGSRCQYEPPILILRNNITWSNRLIFNRSWVQYQNGFGSPSTYYWIGLERLHLQLSQKNCTIQFNLQLRSNGTWRFAKYSRFSVANSSRNYTLTIGGYSGNIGDAMSSSSGRQFSTYDVDNGPPRSECNCSCVASWGGGFWFPSSRVASKAMITMSSNFVWYDTSNVWSPLSSVDVSLLCQTWL